MTIFCTLGDFHGRVKINCPFCEKLSIKVFEIPSYKARDHASQYSSKRGGSAEILSGCEACGKSLKEVKAKLREKY
ncbi:MAG: hypothetical protein WC408_05930 [Candidatus Micrarchaeia archaeon]|jgi:hypothetical protein